MSVYKKYRDSSQGCDRREKHFKLTSKLEDLGLRFVRKSANLANKSVGIQLSFKLRSEKTVDMETGKFP